MALKRNPKTAPPTTKRPGSRRVFAAKYAPGREKNRRRDREKNARISGFFWRRSARQAEIQICIRSEVFFALSCGFVQIATEVFRFGGGRLYIQGVQENQPKKMSRTKKPKLKWVFLFFEDTEILAGNQKISQRRKKPKMPPRKKRRWGVSIGRQGSIIFRAVSARSAWKLWWRMFISSIAYVLCVLMRAATNSKTKEHTQKKKGETDEIAMKKSR